MNWRRIVEQVRARLTGEKLVEASDVLGILNSVPLQESRAAPDRERLDDRREGIRESITFEFSGKVKRTFDVTFNRDAQGVVREVFCAGAHTQSDLQGLVEDSCIALSLALQYGARIADIAKSFGELRDEVASNGPPASPLGAIARRGAEIEAEFAEGAA